jgi:hypothetical protein
MQFMGVWAIKLLSIRETSLVLFNSYIIIIVWLYCILLNKFPVYGHFRIVCFLVTVKESSFPEVSKLEGWNVVVHLIGFRDRGLTPASSLSKCVDLEKWDSSSIKQVKKYFPYDTANKYKASAWYVEKAEKSAIFPRNKNMI